MILRCALIAAAMAVCGEAAVHAAPQCVGDCDGGGEVTINELILGVNIALGSVPLANCSALDADGSGDVTINELISAVNNALTGCPIVNTPTATPSTTHPTATPPPGCGNGVVDFNLGETCDDGNTVDDDGPRATNPCPANCRIAACTSTGSTVTANVSFAAPAGVDVAALTVFLRYPDGVVQIPGMASDDQVQNRLQNLPGNAFSTPNDLDFALRVVLISIDQSPFTPGPLLAVQFDRCKDAAVPTRGDFTCTVEDAADTNSTPVGGVTCAVELP